MGTLEMYAEVGELTTVEVTKVSTFFSLKSSTFDKIPRNKKMLNFYPTFMELFSYFSSNLIM